MKRIALLAALALGALSLNAGVSFSTSAPASQTVVQNWSISVPSSAVAHSFAVQSVYFDQPIYAPVPNGDGSLQQVVVGSTRRYLGLGVASMGSNGANVYNVQVAPYETQYSASRTVSLEAGNYTLYHITQNGTYVSTTITW